MKCNVMYCIVLYCIVLYCIVLYCIVLYCIVLKIHFIVKYAVLYFDCINFSFNISKIKAKKPGIVFNGVSISGVLSSRSSFSGESAGISIG